MKSDFLRSLGPGTQLMMLILIAFFTLFLMQLTAFLVIRPIWQVDIFKSMDEIAKLESAESIQIFKVTQIFYHVGMFLLPALVFRKLFSDPDNGFFVLRKKQESSIWIWAFLLFIIAYPFVNFLYQINLQIPVPSEMAADDAQSTDMLMKLLGGNGMGIILINILVYAVVPAIGEEFLFRGVIMRQIALSTRNIHLSVWVTAAFFSLIHGEITVFIPRFLMGAALGYLFVWSGSIWLSVLAHFCNNILSALIINLTLNNRLDEKYQMLGAYKEDIFLLAISIVATTGLLYLIYQKRNNSYRLFMEDYEREKQKPFRDDDILE